MLYHHPPRPHPPKPAPAYGFLVQKIIAQEHRSIPGLCTELCLHSCDAHSIASVCAGAAPTCWTLTDNGCLQITLPLNVCACDACGHCHTIFSSIDVDTTVPRHFACTLEDPRSTLLILPCVRLLRAEPAGQGCFRVQLSVMLEIDLLRYEVLCTGKPQCPSLPLYPQPVC